MRYAHCLPTNLTTGKYPKGSNFHAQCSQGTRGSWLNYLNTYTESLLLISGSPLVAQSVRVCLQCRRPEFSPWVGKIPWRRKWQPTAPGKPHGQKTLVGCTVHGVARVGHDLTTKPKPAAAAAESFQSCLTPCHPMDCSPPGSPSLGFSRQENWSGVPLPSLNLNLA